MSYSIDLLDIRQGIAAVAGNVTGLKVYTYEPVDPVLPAFVITGHEPLNPDGESFAKRVTMSWFVEVRYPRNVDSVMIERAIKVGSVGLEDVSVHDAFATIPVTSDLVDIDNSRVTSIASPVFEGDNVIVRFTISMIIRPKKEA